MNQALFRRAVRATELVASHSLVGALPRTCIWMVFLAYVALAGCASLPDNVLSPTADITLAYLTVQARVTELVSLTPSPDAFQTTSIRDLTPEAQNLTPSATSSPSATSAGQTPAALNVTLSPTASCNRAAPGNPIDVTIVDDTRLQPGETFQKIWRLENAGACKWDRSYSAIWFSGEKLGETTRVSLSKEVRPGESIEIVVDMQAPDEPGTHWSYWKLADPESNPFGIGPGGNSPFWVKIVVEAPPTLEPTATLLPTASPTLTEEPTSTPTPLAKVAGSASMVPNDMLDLDTNHINAENGNDLAYQPDSAGNHLLSPQGGTLLGVFGASIPGPEACQKAGMASAAIAVESLSPGIYLCYRTDELSYGWLLLETINEDFSLKLEILTWASGG